MAGGPAGAGAPPPTHPPTQRTHPTRHTQAAGYDLGPLPAGPGALQGLGEAGAAAIDPAYALPAHVVARLGLRSSVLPRVEA